MEPKVGFIGSLQHVEILARQLGMEGSTSIKTPGDKADADQFLRYCGVDGEGEAQSEETACYVDELYLKHVGGPRRASASPGWVPAGALTRKDDLKLAQWADIESDDAAPDMSEQLPASRRRAALGAEGWMEGCILGRALGVTDG